MTRTDGPQKLVQEGLYLTLVVGGFFAFLNSIWRQPTVLDALRSAQVQFAGIAVVIVAVSYLGYSQDQKYGALGFLLDVIESFLVVLCLRAFGALEGLLPSSAPSIGWGVFWITVVLFEQLVWRRAVRLPNDPEHYDFRFLLIALLVGAYAVTAWWLRLAFLLLCATLAGIYWTRNAGRVSLTSKT